MYDFILALSYVCICMCLQDHTYGDTLTVPILALTSLDQIVDLCGELMEKSRCGAAKVGKHRVKPWRRWMLAVYRCTVSVGGTQRRSRGSSLT